MTELEQRLYKALEQIRALADAPFSGHVADSAAALDKISDLATLACASVWRSAIATEARRAETENTGSVHDGAGLQGIAQNQSPLSDKEKD